MKKEFPHYEVISVENGFEAINIILEKLPSLIVTDHEMPLMTGIQLIESVRKEDKNSRIPIIAMAANLSDDLKRSYLSHGIRTILEKPVDERIFCEKIMVALN